MTSKNRIITPAPPNLPLGTDQYERRYQDQFTNVLRLYFNQLQNAFGELFGPTGGKYVSFPYGAFSSDQDQTAAANTATLMTFNTTDLSQGVTRGTPTSRIFVDRPNIYNVQFSAQVDKTSGGVALVWVWLRKNGVNVPDSAGQIRIQGNNAEILAAWNYVIQLNAGDYIELMWEVDDTSVILLAEAASAVHPSIPSVILTVTDNISSLET
jgi:hypothetical protein